MFESLLKMFHSSSSPIKRIRWRCIGSVLACLSALLLVTACDGALESSHGGLTVAAFNYTPLNVTRVMVRDAYGNTAYAGGGHPGTGEGSFSCCYALKGNSVEIEWETYERGKGAPPIMQKRSARATIPPLSGEGKGGRSKYLNIHIYPDEHVEMEYTREMLGRTRIDIIEVIRWLDKQPDFEHYNDGRMIFIVAAIVKEAWIKYGLTNTQDLQQYTLLHFKSKTDFDANPAIQDILKKSENFPGQFALAARNLTPHLLKRIERPGGVKLHPLIQLEYYE